MAERHAVPTLDADFAIHRMHGSQKPNLLQPEGSQGVSGATGYAPASLGAYRPSTCSRPNRSSGPVGTGSTRSGFRGPWKPLSMRPVSSGSRAMAAKVLDRSAGTVPALLLQAVVERFDRIEVILFGNRARGDAWRDSDI